MRTVFMRGLAVLVLLLCLCAVVGAGAQQGEDNTTSSSSNSNGISSSSSSSTTEQHISDTRQTTCQSGTVNYITHSLPQQCLSRNTSTPTTTAESTVSPSTTTTTTTTTITSASSIHEPERSATEVAEPESEADSPLDKANFLSFEEWKKQNLAKAGQSPEHVGQQSRDKLPRNMPQIDNALDVLGEDSEIELDFSGFGRQQDSSVASNTETQAPISSSASLRSRDAGKTCKERSNYASFDCAATVLKSNPESKSASAVLIENKDSYMLNICQSPNKFFIIELCDHILIDTIVLANYEFFSSIFRTFRVSVSDRYPVKQDRWKDLGVFEARNTRSVQAFLVEQPLIWARYLRIEFLTHYGNEYYCPVSLLRVHGTTMMEEFRHQEELAHGEISDDLEESVMPEAPESLSQEPVESSKQADGSVAVESVKPVDLHPETTTVSLSTSSTFASDSMPTSDEETTATSNYEPAVSTVSNSSSPQTSQSSSSKEDSTQTISTSTTSATPGSSSNVAQRASTHTETVETSPSASTIHSKDSSISSTVISKASSNSTTSPIQGHATESASINSSSATHYPEHNTTSSSPVSISKSTANTTTSKGSSSTKASSAPSEPHQKSGTSTVSSAHSNPTTQESFFKSIHKRLQMLESNATLSLQYIEEQSRILRDAFVKVEKRQIKKTESFLENLNTTVFAELQDFKQQYDQLWQSTVIELENHREQYQREILAVSARLGIVADELVFQKRMAIVQSTLLMLCLGLVLFVRAGGGTVLEIPLIQQMVNRSQSGRRGSYYSPLNSPSPDQSSPPDMAHDVRRRRGFWRSSPDPSISRPTSKGNGDLSEGSIEAHTRGGNPDLKFEPPTPTYTNSNGESEMDGEDGILVSPTTPAHDDSTVIHEVDSEDETDATMPLSLPQETQSSPSTPSGSRDQQTSLKMLPSWPSSPQAEEDNKDASEGDTTVVETSPAETDGGTAHA